MALSYTIYLLRKIEIVFLKELFKHFHFLDVVVIAPDKIICYTHLISLIEESTSYQHQELLIVPFKPIPLVKDVKLTLCV
jgi:hypothetical protein